MDRKYKGRIIENFDYYRTILFWAVSLHLFHIYTGRTRDFYFLHGANKQQWHYTSLNSSYIGLPVNFHVMGSCQFTPEMDIQFIGGIRTTCMIIHYSVEDGV